MAIKPNINAEKCAEEIKSFIEKKKFDCVDYSYINIEIYPPDSEDYPEIRKFSNQWKKFLDEADSAVDTQQIDEEPGQISYADLLKKYSPEVAPALAEFDKTTNAVADLVNNDKAFWDHLRDVILPLYEKSPYYQTWQDERWKAIALSYDPTALDVKTTEMWTNSKTGERIRGDVKSTTIYPAGFIVKIL